MANDVEKLKDIERKIDDLAIEIDGQGEIMVDGSQKTQIVGDNGVSADVKNNIDSSSSELLVNLEGHVCVDNTTNETLSGGGVFDGDWQDTIDYGTVSISVVADQDSATDGLQILWSPDTTATADSDVFSITANNAKTFTFGPASRYIKIVYTNGAVTQGSFNLQTTLRRVYVKPSSHRIQDSIIGEDDAELVKSVITALDDSGSFTNIRSTLDGNLKVANVSSGLVIAKGDVVGTDFIHKFGNAPNFDTGDNSVNVWDGADSANIDQMVYIYSSTDDIDSISSSNDTDTQDIEIQGLDINYALVVQTITLTGQTRKALDTDLIRVFRMKNVGTTDNAGHVYCYVDSEIGSGVPTDSTKVRAVMQPANNQTLMALFTIPAGKTGYMRDWYASTAGGSRDSNYIIDLFARPFGQVFQIKHKASINEAGTSYIQHVYEEPEVFTEKTDIHIKAQITATAITGASVSGGFDIVLIDN